MLELIAKLIMEKEHSVLIPIVQDYIDTTT